MKLSDWAKEQGICYKTAWRWFKDGKLPVLAEQTVTGTILVKNEIIENNSLDTIIYCRVSNHSRKEELNYQVQRCEEFCLKNGWSVKRVYKEIASGLNDERKEFWKAIDSKPKRLIVENKDRLTRFGFNYIKKLLNQVDKDIIVLNETIDDKNDLMKDLISIIYSFSARMYGLRRKKNKNEIVKFLEN
jgi:predicted site-specific integrase-resolvase